MLRHFSHFSFHKHFMLIYFYECVHVCVGSCMSWHMQLKIRLKLIRFSSLLSQHSSHDQKSGSQVGIKCLYPRNHFDSQIPTIWMPNKIFLLWVIHYYMSKFGTLSHVSINDSVPKVILCSGDLRILLMQQLSFSFNNVYPACRGHAFHQKLRIIFL